MAKESAIFNLLLKVTKEEQKKQFFTMSAGLRPPSPTSVDIDKKVNIWGGLFTLITYGFMICKN